MERKRACDSPPPQHGGAHCDGEGDNQGPCFVGHCAGALKREQRERHM